LLIGWYTRLFKFMEPIIELLRPIPSIGLLGLGLLLFGIGSGPVVFITFYGCFFILLMATAYGTYSVEETLVLVMRSMRASQVAIFTQVVLPASLPFIFGGLRQSLATAWILTVAGEMIIGSEGLGVYIVETQRTFQIAAMYATLVLLGILGYVTTQLLILAEGRLIRWRNAQRSSAR
jgi:ABC-type nitrate/sulfonate/bicarbonate transport system permease component